MTPKPRKPMTRKSRRGQCRHMRAVKLPIHEYIEWCPRCGAIRFNEYGNWRVPVGPLPSGKKRKASP